MRLLVLALVARFHLYLDHRVPQSLVGIPDGIERADDDIAVLAPVRTDLLSRGDQADDLLEVVAARGKLLTRGAECPVGAIPRERAMLRSRLIGELLLEQPLPPARVPRPGRLVEQQQVAPIVHRIARRADHEVALAPQHHVIGRQHVDVGRPYE